MSNLWNSCYVCFGVSLIFSICFTHSRCSFKIFLIIGFSSAGSLTCVTHQGIMVHSSRLQKNKIGNPLPFFSLPDFSYYCFLFLLSLFPFLFWIPWAFSFYPVLSSYSVFSNMKIKVVRCRKGRNKEATKDQKDIGGGWGRLNKDEKEERRKGEKICWITHHLPFKYNSLKLQKFRR